MTHLAFRRRLIESLSEPIRSSVSPGARSGPRASHHLERLQPVHHFPQKGKDEIVWSVATDKVEQDTSLITSVVLAQITLPCA